MRPGPFRSFGSAPAWRASRVHPTEALREGSRGNTGGRASWRARDLLVAGQVAVALMLLVGAGMLMRSFVALQRIDLGFAADQVTTFEVNLPEARYGDPAARVRFHETFQDRLRRIPGVQRVGATSWLPANGDYHQWGFAYTSADGSRDDIPAQIRVVDGDYFATLRIPLVSGRLFSALDVPDSVGVAVISRALAEAAFGGRDPSGELFRTGGRSFRVIGVVGEVAQEAAGTKDPQRYLSHRQFADDRNWTLTYVVRTGTTESALFGPARTALAEIDPALVLFAPRPLEAVVARHRARERFTLLLMATFAGVALSLAAIGLYGVLSYAVTQRGHEIGVRMALGARPGQVRAAVLGHGVRIGAAGMLVGLAGALALSRMLASAMFGARARDPMVFVVVVSLLAAVVLLAGYIPAHRATRVDPLEAFRAE